MSFYRVHTYGDGMTRVIESDNDDIACNVYADIEGFHPLSVSCTCCGPKGLVWELSEDEVLEEMENETSFVFENEYTGEQVHNGAKLYYHVDE